MAYNESLARSLPLSTDGFNASFRRLIYSHLTYLRVKYSNKLLTVTPFEAYKYRGDLYGLLRSKGFNNKMVWVISMVNGIDDPTLFDGTITQFILPAQEEVSLLERRHNSIDSELK